MNILEELSVEHGSPVELYDIALGADSWHFTTSEDDQVIAGVTYTAFPIIRDTIALGPEERTQLISISLPSDHAFVQKYTQSVPGSRASLTIRRFHRFDADVETVQVFKGLVRSVAFSNNGTQAKVGVMPMTGAMSRPIPRYVYSSLCNAVLGDGFSGGGFCTVDLESGSDLQGLAHKRATLIDSVAGASLFHSLTDRPADFFDGGFATYNGDYRLILKDAFGSLKLILPFNVDVTGLTVTCYAGCDHSFTTCIERFGQNDNFQGYPFVPSTNLFTKGLT